MVFNEQIILEKLNKLNISKSPGPDGIHPRVLFELRYEVLEPLNILFESSYKLGKLLDNDSVMARTVNGFKTKLERERAKKMGLFLD